MVLNTEVYKKHPHISPLLFQVGHWYVESHGNCNLCGPLRHVGVLVLAQGLGECGFTIFLQQSFKACCNDGCGCDWSYVSEAVDVGLFGHWDYCGWEKQ